jgi:hypothetical protein
MMSMSMAVVVVAPLRHEVEAFSMSGFLLGELEQEQEQELHQLVELVGRLLLLLWLGLPLFWKGVLPFWPCTLHCAVPKA